MRWSNIGFQLEGGSIMRNSTHKAQVLEQMEDMLAQLNGKLKILSALDSDMTDSSAGDLHDQITGMADAIDSLAGTIGRAKRVNPQHKETANA
jgi:hypothetical protein